MTITRFSDVVQLNTTRTADPLSAGIKRFVGLEHIEPENLHIRSWGNVADGTTFTNTFKRGQVLFGKRRAYQRKVAVAEFDGVCSSDIYVFESQDPNVLLPELLPFICQSEGFFEYAVKTSAGSLSPRTNWSHLANFEFPLPPLDEQRRIADLLWAADDSMTEYANAIQSLEKLKTSYWQNLKLNDKYPFVKLRDTAEIATGSTPNRGTDSYWKNGTIPWLPTQKVNEKIIRQADEFITERAFKECSMKLFSADSILVALYGEGKTRGASAYLTFDSCINQAFAAVKPSEKLDGWFLYHFLDNSYTEIRAYSHGSSQKNLNAQLLGQFKIPLPEKTEQEAIARMLNDFSARTTEILAHIENLKTLKKNLFTALL